MIQSPIMEIDVHGCTVDEAVKKIDACIKKATSATYRIRIIHGYNRGTNIQQAIYREFGYGLEPKIKRIIGGNNPGITELILREY